MTAENTTENVWQRLERSIAGVIKGQDDLIQKVLCCFAAGGHLLLEDYPGTGKTTLAKTLAKSISGANYQRIQFTPDLLPSDLLGVSVLDPRTGEFNFHKGPIFSHVLLADEINRASPRTQSALLEVMAEKQATIEGTLHTFDDVFFVIATQNPVEFRGTYPLPEAQMDRFAMQCSLGYVSVEDEMQILTGQQQGEHPAKSVSPLVNLNDVKQWKESTAAVHITDELKHYIVTLVAATREMQEVKLPASPRASLSLMKVSQAMSLLKGRDFVTPEIIQACAEDTIAHRLVLDADAKFSGKTGRSIVRELLEQIPVPV